MSNDATSSIGNFMLTNAKTIGMCIMFLIGFYLQHQANTMKIVQLEEEVNKVNQRLDQQYTKLDNIKLDKTVFEATLKQLSDMSMDIRSIRERLEDMMDKQYK